MTVRGSDHFCACGRGAVVATPYSERRDPALPWGYWLRTSPQSSGRVLDETGREWPSIREALWCGRLGMPSLSTSQDDCARPRFRNERQGEELFELLIAVLSVCGRIEGASAREAGVDMFSGTHAAWLMLVHQIEAWDLAARRDDAEPLLTDEGRAVLLMLRATRPPELHLVPPGRRAMDILAEGGFEHVANPHVDLDKLRVTFSREEFGRRPMIVLIDRRTAKGRMPVVETIWSMTFDRRDMRDRFFAWLAARSDRWEALGDMARRDGSGALSAHLLAVYMASTEEAQSRPLALPAPSKKSF